MVDVFLVVLASIVPTLLLGMNVFIVTYYLHPEDRKEAMWLKVLLFLGFTFAECAILLLPLDVANKGGIVGCGLWNTLCGELRMDLLWQIVYMSIAVWSLVLVPYAMFYYEADNGVGNDKNSRHCSAFTWTASLFVCVVPVLIVAYFLLRESYLPISVISQPAAAALVPVPGLNTTAATTAAGIPSIVLAANEVPCLGTSGCDVQSKTLTIRVTFPIFVVGVLSFVGWFLFIVFGGVGVIALPADLIKAYRDRPKFMGLTEFTTLKEDVRRRTGELAEIGERLREEMKEVRDAAKAKTLKGRELRARRSELRTTLNQFKAAVFILDKTWEDTRMCREGYATHNPLVPIGKLVLAVCTIILSVVWLLHIGLYMLPKALGQVPPTLFLNDYFVFFDGTFTLMGTISLGVLAMMLLAFVIKGNFKVGIRFFCFAIHPVKAGGTMLNSLFFNLGLILLACAPVVQFCTQAFADYARLTDAEVIFSTQIRYLQFFRYMYAYNVFIYGFLAFALFAGLYALICPGRDDVDVDKLRDRVQAKRRAHAREMRSMA